MVEAGENQVGIEKQGKIPHRMIIEEAWAELYAIVGVEDHYKLDELSALHTRRLLEAWREPFMHAIAEIGKPYANNFQRFTNHEFGGEKYSLFPYLYRFRSGKIILCPMLVKWSKDFNDQMHVNTNFDSKKKSSGGKQDYVLGPVRVEISSYSSSSPSDFTSYKAVIIGGSISEFESKTVKYTNRLGEASLAEDSKKITFNGLDN